MGGVLQHGSLPLFGDLTRITQALAFPDAAARQAAAARLLAHATTAEWVLGARLDFDTVANALRHGFEQALDLQFEKAELSERELTRAEELVQEKYANRAWTERV
jgi:lipoate-protein ligase A